MTKSFIGIDMKKNPTRIVLDTNILVSALVYGGNPKKTFLLALDKQIQVVTSPVLQAEFTDVIAKKFPLSLKNINLLKRQVRKTFIMVQPSRSIDIARDDDDNRVLEAAIEGGCDYIVTGDKDLLELKSYKDVKIVTAIEFLKEFK